MRSPVREGSLRQLAISFDTSLQEIKSFLLNLPNWTNTKAVGIISFPSGGDFHKLSLRIAREISKERTSILFAKDLEHGWLEDEKNKNRSLVRDNHAVDSELFEESAKGVFCSKNDNLTVVSLKEIGSARTDNISMDHLITDVFSSYGADKRIFVDIPSVRLMKTCRSSLGKFIGVVVVVDSKYVKESDWKFLEEDLNYMKVPILATILISK